MKKFFRNKKSSLLFWLRPKFLLLVIFGLVFVSGGFLYLNKPAEAAVAKLLNYQAKVLDSSGVPIADGSYDVIFRICAASDCSGASDPLWTETWNSGTSQVTVTNGLFSVLLGSYTALDLDFNSSSYYLGVNFNGDGEMAPRKRIAGAAWSLNSNLLDGLDTSDSGSTAAYVLAGNASGNVVITGSPWSSSVDGGPIYVNPASAGANNTLLGVAVGGAEKFRVDEDGDTSLAGALTFTSNGETINNAANGIIEGSASLAADDNLYVNYNGPDGDSYIYFYDGSSATGAHLMWDDNYESTGLAGFELNNFLALPGSYIYDSNGDKQAMTGLTNDGLDFYVNLDALSSSNTGSMYITLDADTASSKFYIQNDSETNMLFSVGGAGLVTLVNGETIDNATDNQIAFSDTAQTLTMNFDADTSTAIDFVTSSNIDLTFNPGGTGKVGIGTVSPDALLDIETTENTEILRFTDSTNSDSVGFYTGNASPESVVAAQLGSIFLDNANGAAYVKDTGDGTNTGWKQLAITGGTGGLDFDDIYANSILNSNLTMEIDDTGGLAYNLTTTGDFSIQDNGTTFFNFGNDSNVTYTALAASKFFIDASTNAHTDTNGVLDMDVRSGDANVNGIDITLRGDANNTHIANKSTVYSGGMSSGVNYVVGNGVYLYGNSSDAVVNGSNFGILMGNIVSSSGSSTTDGNGYWWANYVDFNTVPVASSGGVSMYKGSLDYRSTGDIYGLELELDNNTSAANSIYGSNISITSDQNNAAGIVGYYVDFDLSGTPAASYGLYISSSGSTALDSDIRLQNAETIDNKTDGSVAFTGSGGTNDAGLIIDLDGATTATPTLSAAANDVVAINDNLSVGVDGNTAETIDNTGFSMSGDDLFVAGMAGIEGNVYTDGAFVAGASLTLSDSAILDSNGPINLQADNDTDDYIYLTTLSDVPYIYWEGLTANDPGFRVNSTTNKLEYRDENDTAWVSFDSLAGSGYWDRDSVNKYVYPAYYASGDSVRVFDTTKSDYIDIKHDGTDATFSFAGTSATNQI